MQGDVAGRLINLETSARNSKESRAQESQPATGFAQPNVRGRGSDTRAKDTPIGAQQPKGLCPQRGVGEGEWIRACQTGQRCENLAHRHRADLIQQMRK